MFVETRTTHTEVLADMFKEVGYKANSVLNQARNHRAHPTFNTKTAIRNELQQLLGMAQLARSVSGDSLLPDDLEDRITNACNAVRTM